MATMFLNDMIAMYNCLRAYLPQSLDNAAWRYNGILMLCYHTKHEKICPASKWKLLSMGKLWSIPLFIAVEIQFHTKNKGTIALNTVLTPTPWNNWVKSHFIKRSVIRGSQTVGSGLRRVLENAFRDCKTRLVLC